MGLISAFSLISQVLSTFAKLDLESIYLLLEDEGKETCSEEHHHAVELFLELRRLDRLKIDDIHQNYNFF